MKCSEITYKKVSELVLLPENPRTITKNDFERLVDSCLLYTSPSPRD